MNNLTRLEKLCKSAKFVSESNYGNGERPKLKRIAVRTIDGTLLTRTHNIHLTDTSLWWENSNSKDWRHEFPSKNQATDWWKKHIGENI